MFTRLKVSQSETTADKSDEIKRSSVGTAEWESVDLNR